VFDRTGAVQAMVSPANAEVGRIIHRADERRRREQRRSAVTLHRHVNAMQLNSAARIGLQNDAAGDGTSPNRFREVQDADNALGSAAHTKHWTAS
jgi:hypothetical protein